MLLRILILLVIIAGGVAAYFWFQGSLQLPFKMSETPAVLGTAVTLPEGAGTQLSELSSRAKTVVDQAGTVMGTAVQESTASGSIQERAFMYARYLYCQQVVKDYETQNN